MVPNVYREVASLLGVLFGRYPDLQKGNTFYLSNFDDSYFKLQRAIDLKLGYLDSLLNGENC